MEAQTKLYAAWEAAENISPVKMAEMKTHMKESELEVERLRAELTGYASRAKGELGLREDEISRLRCQLLERRSVGDRRVDHRVDHPEEEEEEEDGRVASLIDEALREHSEELKSENHRLIREAAEGKAEMDRLRADLLILEMRPPSKAVSALTDDELSTVPELFSALEASTQKSSLLENELKAIGLEP